MKRSPTKGKPSEGQPPLSSRASPQLEDAGFNPLAALQSVVAGDLVPIKQRSKAAQQLATYLCELPTTPSLYAFYEPYLPIVAGVVVAPIKAARDAQENTLKMLKALASHSPRQFVEWCALHTSMSAAPESWCVDWCGGLLLAAETRIPRAAIDGFAELAVWDTNSLEYQEVDAAAAAVVHLWRSILDNAGDEAVVYEIAAGIKTLLSYQPTASEQLWRALVTSKIQPHFVDMADVLIGWTMSPTTSKRLREAIIALLDEMGELWLGNSVFCSQLLESFASDIGSIYASPAASEEDFGRLDSIILCSTLVAQCIPSTVHGGLNSQFGFVEKLLFASDPSRFIYSSTTVARLSEYLTALCVVHAERFTPLAMRAIRFLVCQLAAQLASRRCDMHVALSILERASHFSRRLSAANANRDSRVQAKNLLTDEVLVDDETKSKCSVLEILLTLKYFQSVKYTTQIVIQTAVYIGIEGLQVVAARIDRKMQVPEDPSISFWSTCFILACKSGQISRPLGDTATRAEVSASIQLILYQAKSLPRTTHTASFALAVLKLAPVFVGVTKKMHDPSLKVAITELVLEFVQVCIHFLQSDSPEPAFVRELFVLLAWGLSSYQSKKALTVDLQEAIVKVVRQVIEQDLLSVSTECVKLLTALAPLVSTHASCAAVLQLAAELLDTADDSDSERLTRHVIPSLNVGALMGGETAHFRAPATPTSWRNVWVQSEMSVGDFERIYELLAQPDTTNDAWHRASRRIHSRMRRGNVEAVFDRPALWKMVVREAAKWVVQNRLRSPLGPPSAIFSGVEKILLAHAYRQQSVASRGESGSSVSATMLVEFVLAMEVLFRIATDLKCEDISSDGEAQKVQGFFRANVAVCEEWLSRIRPALVDLSTSLKQTESSMNHSTAMVTSLARKLDAQLSRSANGSSAEGGQIRVVKYTIDLEGAVFSLAESLCKLGDADSISGLQTWWSELLLQVARSLLPTSSEWEQRTIIASATFTWLPAIASEAELKYEEAIKQYESVVNSAMTAQLPADTNPELTAHPLLSPFGVSFDTFVGCLRRCGLCYTSLRRWDDLRGLLRRCVQFAQNIGGWMGKTVSYARFVELCEAWRVEEPVVSVLSAIDSGSFVPATDKEAVARASASIQKWSQLSDADHSIARSFVRAGPEVGLREVYLVSESLQSLRFRPTQSFVDTLHPSSLRERESTLLLASLLADRNSNDLGSSAPGHTVSSNLMETTVDPILWSRSNVAPQDRESTISWWLSIVRAARKHKNYSFAVSALKKLKSGALDSLPDSARLAVLYEEAVLKLVGENCSEGVTTLVKLCDSVLRSKDKAQEHALPESVHMRALLKLARTLASVDTGDEFVAIEAAMSLIGSRVERNASNGLVEYRDNLVMMCLTSATEIAPLHPRAWYEFSKWSHHQGRQGIDTVVANGGIIELLPPEQEQLDQLIEESRILGFKLDEADLYGSFHRVMDGGSFVSNRDERLRKVLSRGALSNVQQDLLARFSALQAQAVSRLLQPIRNAAIGYRSFLHTADAQKDNARSRRDNSRITSVALRLLRVLTRLGSEAEIAGVVADVFVSGPLSPWGRIVPQLLSRIGHSYSGVSTPVASLLVRLAGRYPHLVVYPAIVELGRNEDADRAGAKLLNGVVANLRDTAPELTEGVVRMVDELKRISILWDDAWIWALVKMSGDVNRRISTLEREAQRVNKNSTLLAEEKVRLARRKAIAIMTPVLVAVERLWMDTLGRAVPGYTLTPHEKQFAHKYGSTISTAIQVFRSYCGNGSVSSDFAVTSEAVQPREDSLSPAEIWRPFAELLKTLMAAVGRRERVDLAEVSPILARTSHKSKAALMPESFASDNFDVSSSEMVNISDISRTVVILRTKTKPKCFKFVGSDGKVHRYLLKAREDLRLDERMMQFLDAANEFLRADRPSSARHLRARNYSVVPISNEAGLIQMVPEVLPLFQIYTSRVEGIADGTSVSAVSDGDEAIRSVQQSPTAPFYAKLKQYGIQDVSPAHRSRWPLSVLRRVHEDLVLSRPSNVVHRELVAQSTDFADAWAKKYRFGRSTAVMSVLGYLVGLGDRHLDNMLLCTNTGELLHIDYNVCFDKGRKLKVPEIVPFRLTPMVLDGFGLTGVDGVFRSAFVNTMRVVRDPDSREALLALLDAFVYDPLVDWVADAKHLTISRDSKQRMDANVNLSLFLSRARERSQETTTFVSQFAALSRQVKDLLEEIVGWFGQETIRQCKLYVQAIEAKQSADEMMLNLERKWDNLVVNLPQKQDDASVSLAIVEEDKSAVSAFATECSGRHQQIVHILGRLADFIPPSILDSHPNIVGQLTQAHGGIVRVAMQSPTSPATPVWTNMLVNLEPRCQALDQQIPVVLDRCDRVARDLAAVLEQYKTRRSRCRDGNTTEWTVDDVYEVWAQCCGELRSALDSSDLFSAQEIIHRVLARLDGHSQDSCACVRHEKLIVGLKEEVGRLGGLTLTGNPNPRDEGEMNTLVQQFLNDLSSLKLSNSQTQRVVKLINTRWVISALGQLESTGKFEADRSVGDLGSRSVLHSLQMISFVTIILRQLAQSSKGSMRKSLFDMIAGSAGLSSNGNDAVHTTLDCVISMITTLEAISSSSVDHLVRRQCGAAAVNVFQQSLDRGAEVKPVSDHATRLAGGVEKLRAASSHIELGSGSNLGARIKTLLAGIQDLVDSTGPRDTCDFSALDASVKNLIISFATESLIPLLSDVVRLVVCNEWKFDATVFELGVDHVDSLALEAMPALSSAGLSPTTGFQSCCKTFGSLWSTWKSQSAHTADSEEMQRRLCTVTDLLEEHKHHVGFVDWVQGRAAEQGDGELTRREMLDQIAALAPSLPLLYEETERLESNILEVAQQLEYVASQVSFSCTMGFSSGEVELQMICREVQELYNHTARHFEAMRSVSDIAIAINAIETSLFRVCRDPSLNVELIGEAEANQVGRGIFERAAAHLEKLVEVQNQGEDTATVSLKEQLEAASAAVTMADRDVKTRQQAFAELCGAYKPTEVFSHINALVQHTSALAVLTRSLKPASGVSESEKPDAQRKSTRKPADQAAFSLAENERLIKILHRSVEPVSFMQELGDVLVDHDLHYQKLTLAGAELEDALTTFVSSAGDAVESQNIALCIRAVGKVVDAVDAAVAGSGDDMLSTTRSLLESCCRRFFDAAELADELTNAEDRATTLGENGGVGNDGEEEDVEEDSSGQDDEDLKNSLSIPLRPIAGFQEQNLYGADVVSRIDEKLGGVVIESGSRDPLSVEDQSSWLIRAATDVDNLCVMYEGWTPWI